MLVKILCLCVFVVIAGSSHASRELRSSGGSGWQGNTNDGYAGLGTKRASIGGWSGSGLSRSQAGWGGLGRSGSNGYNSDSFSGRSSGCDTARSTNGWGNANAGYRSSGTGNW